MNSEERDAVNAELDRIEAEECQEWVSLTSDPEVITAEIRRLRRALRYALPALALAEQKAHQRLVATKAEDRAVAEYTQITTAKGVVEEAIDETP